MNTKFVSTQNLLREFREGRGVSVWGGQMEKIKFAHALCKDFYKKAKT